MTSRDVRVSAEALRLFVTALLLKTGMRETDASFFTEALVNSDLWGIGSHGVLRLPIYIKRLKSGAMNSRPQVKTIQSAKGLEIIHGDDGPGFITGRAAMTRAITLAKKYNVAAVGAIRSNHFGAAGIYTRMATEKDMIGICMTNVVQNIVVPGGSKPIVGNNPISAAIPTFGEFPFVLDISMSAIAGGKLLLASEKGEKIPIDWATDNEGKPTDDPDKAFDGFLLPMGGHKGFGLALLVEVLCGVITGGAFLDKMKGMYKYPDDPSLTGHFMIAINPLSIMGPETFKERMTDFCSIIKSSPMWDDSSEMLIPGEIEHKTAIKRKKRGIPIPKSLYEDLQEMARQENVLIELKTVTG